MLLVKNLLVSVEGKRILKGVSLEVGAGEVHALMGPNGSGKSTLAYALAGHPGYKVGNSKFKIQNSREAKKSGLRIRNSSIEMDGEDLLGLSPDERARRGLFLAFQYPVEVPGVKVNNFLRQAYEARFGEDEAKRFESVLAFRRHLEGLADQLEVDRGLLKRGLNEGFSGGEKKRLEILQMALLEPKYGLLDETDSGLDIDAIKVVAAGVKKVVGKYNTGVVVITHYRRILKYLKPDRVHVMVDGEVVESGGEEVAERLERRGYREWGVKEQHG